MESHLRSIWCSKLNKALGQRRPMSVVHYSGQGMQYASVAFGIRSKETGVRPSMGPVGDAYRNLICESFFATLERELLDRARLPNQAEAKIRGFDEGCYIPHRHSALPV